jgi:hypothetical protein
MCIPAACFLVGLGNIVVSLAGKVCSVGEVGDLYVRRFGGEFNFYLGEANAEKTAHTFRTLAVADCPAHAALSPPWLSGSDSDSDNNRSMLAELFGDGVEWGATGHSERLA